MRALLPSELGGDVGGVRDEEGQAMRIYIAFLS